jgi:uncharacterized protein
VENTFLTSRYNFNVPLKSAYFLFNTSTGALISFTGSDAAELSRLLSGKPKLISGNHFDINILNQLRRNGFLVNPEFDELQEIRERYHTARGNTPIVLTLTTTMDCNLSCYYCYESRSKHHLEIKNIDQVLDTAWKLLQQSKKKSLHIDWFGGEPLMNLEFLHHASIALQKLCEDNNIKYSASVISNGTCWPAEVGSFIRNHKIRQVQISFDGLRENHNRRRRYRKDYLTDTNMSSFDEAVSLVDKLLNYVRVDLRFNMDSGNTDDFLDFIDFAKSRKWFDAPFKCILYPAKLAAYSERSEFMRQKELPTNEFDSLFALALERLPATFMDEFNNPKLLPKPKTSVCAALANNSVVIGSDGLEYRCCLQVGETNHAVGKIGMQASNESFPDKIWWENFDPTTLPNCSRCSFLPICWGGCPKAHLDVSSYETDEYGLFWRKYLPGMIANSIKEAEMEGFAYGEDDQFRYISNS